MPLTVSGKGRKHVLAFLAVVLVLVAGLFVGVRTVWAGNAYVNLWHLLEGSPAPGQGSPTNPYELLFTDCPSDTQCQGQVYYEVKVQRSNTASCASGCVEDDYDGINKITDGIVAIPIKTCFGLTCACDRDTLLLDGFDGYDYMRYKISVAMDGEDEDIVKQCCGEEGRVFEYSTDTAYSSWFYTGDPSSSEDIAFYFGPNTCDEE